jgi:hypothetical protein
MTPGRVCEHGWRGVAVMDMKLDFAGDGVPRDR